MVEDQDNPKVDLKALFLALQEELAASLNKNRQALTHPGAKGEATELAWKEMLEAYLPRRYSVSKAFVVDSNGDRSEQIDIVIFDRQYCPFLFTSHDQHYIPAESVYAVIEVKQCFNREHVLYAGQKAESVRRLHRTSASIHHAGGVFEPRVPFRIVAGILALESSWSLPLDKPLIATLNELSYDARLDLGCCLQAGAFKAEYSNTGTSLETTDQTIALVAFFVSLIQRLQRMGSAPAIDFDTYASAVSKNLWTLSKAIATEEPINP